MTFITQPKKEGEIKDCPSCGTKIVARLKEYKDYPNKIQWQNEKETTAHYDKDGNCKGQTPEQAENDAGATFFQKNTVEITSSSITSKTEEKQVRDYLEPDMKKLIADQTQQIIGIRSVVQTVCKDTLGDTHPGMVWEMTALLYQKYFGGKKE